MLDFLLDFYFGISLINAMPHLVLGQLGIRFLCLFGYSPKANIAYSFVNVLAAVLIGIYKFGFDLVINSPTTYGLLFVYFGFVFMGPMLVKIWHHNHLIKKGSGKG